MVNTVSVDEVDYIICQKETTSGDNPGYFTIKSKESLCTMNIHLAQNTRAEKSK